jgi:1,2-phenylacetyl-CoA epoxidase catalytic subunit
MISSRVRAEWRNRVAAEYRSAAITSALLHKAILAAFPEPLLHTALRIVRDELDHAALSHGVLVELGGSADPVILRMDDLLNRPATSSETVLAELTDSVVRDFCLGETFAVPLFHAMRRTDTDPRVHVVLTRVLADEAIHRQFGWDALDELLARDPTGVRRYVAERLGGWLRAFQQAYAAEGDAPPLTAAERAMGLIDLPEYRQAFAQALHDDIGPRFASRGVSLP